MSVLGRSSFIFHPHLGWPCRPSFTSFNFQAILGNGRRIGLRDTRVWLGAAPGTDFRLPQPMLWENASIFT